MGLEQAHGWPPRPVMRPGGLATAHGVPGWPPAQAEAPAAAPVVAPGVPNVAQPAAPPVNWTPQQAAVPPLGPDMVHTDPVDDTPTGYEALVKALLARKTQQA